MRKRVFSVIIIIMFTGACARHDASPAPPPAKYTIKDGHTAVYPRGGAYPLRKDEKP